MTDTFDQQVTDSLRYRASAATTEGRGFGDVRRRVRRRRQRHIAYALTPAVAGMSYLATRAPSDGNSVQPASAGLTDTTAHIAATSTTIITAVAEPSSTTPNTDGTSDVSASTSTTLASGEIGEVLCLNASDAIDAARLVTTTYFGGNQTFDSPLKSKTSFVMALRPDFNNDADWAAGVIGVPVHPLDTRYLPTDLELSGTRARVVIVVGDDVASHANPTPTTLGGSTG